MSTFQVTRKMNARGKELKMGDTIDVAKLGVTPRRVGQLVEQGYLVPVEPTPRTEKIAKGDKD